MPHNLSGAKIALILLLTVLVSATFLSKSGIDPYVEVDLGRNSSVSVVSIVGDTACNSLFPFKLFLYTGDRKQLVSHKEMETLAAMSSVSSVVSSLHVASVRQPKCRVGAPEFD